MRCILRSGAVTDARNNARGQGSCGPREQASIAKCFDDKFLKERLLSAVGWDHQGVVIAASLLIKSCLVVV